MGDQVLPLGFAPVAPVKGVPGPINQKVYPQLSTAKSHGATGFTADAPIPSPGEANNDYDRYVQSLLAKKEDKELAAKLSVQQVKEARAYAQMMAQNEYAMQQAAQPSSRWGDFGWKDSGASLPNVPSAGPKVLPPIGGTGPATNAEAAGGTMERDHGKGFQGLFHPAGGRTAPAGVSNKLMSFADVPAKDAGGALLGLIGNIADAIGAGRAAYAGRDSPTRLQKEWAMKLESQRAANQIYAAMDAEIKKLEPSLKKEIKLAIEQGRIDVARDIAIKNGIYPLERELIKLQNYINYVNGQVPSQAALDYASQAPVDLSGPSAPTGR